MTTQPKAAKVSNVKQGIISDPDLNIGRFLDNAEKRNLRLVSKELNQAFFDNLECADAQELQAMRSEPEPCKSTAKVIYNPEKGIQRAIMCAIFSDQKLHVYVETGTKHLDPLLKSTILKCFDKNYALRLTLLYPRDPQTQEYPEYPPPQPEGLRCDGGFRPLKVAVARNGRLENQEGVQVVRFTGNTLVAKQAFFQNQTVQELLDVDKIKTIRKNAFDSCNQLKKLGDMPELIQIRGWAFDRSSLGEVGDMPKLEQIGTHAFTETRLTKVGKMPELKSIGYSAFLSCRSLEEVGDMPQLKIMKGMAFEVCRLLKKVGDMSNLEEIRKCAFCECNSLQKICLPNTLKHVGDDAFKGCPLEELSVEPGAQFDCYCENLASKLRLLKGVNVTGDRPPYKIQAFRLQARTTQGLTTRQIRLLLRHSQ